MPTLQTRNCIIVYVDDGIFVAIDNALIDQAISELRA
jgi:hypothetical protein